jgi:lipid-binding SYLF domain-containing protein
MASIFIRGLLLSASLLVFAGCVTTPAQYSSTESIFRSAGESGAFFDKAYAYALFPTIGKGGIGIGGARGRGGVFRGGSIIGETSMTQLSAGVQLGGQSFSQIIFFEDERALQEFCTGNFEFGVNASAVAITAGASASASTTGKTTSTSSEKTNATAYGQFYKGTAVFTITKGGLMYEATLSGQKFQARC